MMLISPWLPVPQQCRTLITTNLRAAAPRPSETSNGTAPNDLIQLSEACSSYQGCEWGQAGQPRFSGLQ